MAAIGVVIEHNVIILTLFAQAHEPQPATQIQRDLKIEGFVFAFFFFFDNLFAGQTGLDLNSLGDKTQPEPVGGYLWSLLISLSVTIQTFHCRNIDVGDSGMIPRPPGWAMELIH